MRIIINIKMIDNQVSLRVKKDTSVKDSRLESQVGEGVYDYINSKVAELVNKGQTTVNRRNWWICRMFRKLFRMK